MDTAVAGKGKKAKSIVGLILGICSVLTGLPADFMGIYLGLMKRSANADGSDVARQMMSAVLQITSTFSIALIIIGAVLGIIGLLLCRFGADGKAKKAGTVLAVIGIVLAIVAAILFIAL